MTQIPAAGAIPVSDVIGSSLVRVAADATVADVARAIAAAEVGAVVVGAEGRAAALVSERDVVRAVAGGEDPAGVRALDVASTDLVRCAADTTTDEAATRMIDHHIRHMLVERDGELVGIVSARDLLGVYASDADVNPL